MVQYLYEGELSPTIATYVRNAMSDYPNAVELSDNLDHAWIEANLPIYTWNERTFSGHYYEKKSHKYCVVSKGLDGKPGVFFFVSTQKEKDMILQGCPDLVVNANPFRTVI